MMPKTSAGLCLVVGSLFGLLLQVSGDGVLARDMTDTKQCSDVNGLSVQPGVSYTPGPDYCTVCKCEDGSPKFCRAVLCQPRPDCHSFRVGTTCCDFICLDDVLPNRPGGHPVGKLPDGTHYPAGGNGLIPHINENGENSLGMRLAAAILTALMAFVLLLFLVHRLRQRRITAQQYVNAQDVACCHPAAYWHASDQASLFLQAPHWKPPSCVIDAPPPYTEADAQRAAARAVFANGVVTSMPSSAPPSYSGPVPALPFAPPDAGATALPVTSLGHHLDGSIEDASRDVLSSHAETRSTDSTGPGGPHVPPASLGPLAVQLLPAASNSADLREQIRRQRRNLTDHNTRSLPRPSHPPTGGVPQVSPRRVAEKPPLHCTLARPPASDSPSGGAQQSPFAPFAACSPPAGEGAEQAVASGMPSEIGDSHVERSNKLKQEELLKSSARMKENSEEPSQACISEQDDVNEGMQDPSAGSSSIVRKSVLKFEAAAAALEASDTYSVGSNSPAGIASQHSPSRPATSASRYGSSSSPRNGLSSSPHRKQELPHGLVDCPIPEGLHSPAQQTAFHFPLHAPSSHPFNTTSHEGSFHLPPADYMDPPSESRTEDLQRRYPSYEATYACTRQPLLPRDRDTSSPERGGKVPRRRQHSLTPDSAGLDRAFSASAVSGPASSHFSSHPSKAKNKPTDVFQRSDDDFEVNDRESFEYSDARHRNAGLCGDVQNFRFSGRRTGRRHEPSTVNCSSGARNKT